MAAPTVLGEATTAAHSPTLPLRMTFEEYVACDFEHGLAEWVNGEVVRSMSTTEVHQRVAEFLLVLLRLFVRQRKLGRVIGGPYIMRAAVGGNGREPDVMFVSTEHLSRLGPTYLEGPADLVVEVISDDSVSRDRDDKFSEYQDAGVREYWIIDPRPNRRRADFYVLSVKGRYQPVPVPDDNRYRSTVLGGFWLDVDWLWQDDPDELAALVAIFGPSQLPASLTTPSLEGR